MLSNGLTIALFKICERCSVDRTCTFAALLLNILCYDREMSKNQRYTEKARAYNKAYKQRDYVKKRQKEFQKVWRQNNLNKTRVSNKKWRENNKQSVKVRGAKYYIENKERLGIRRRVRYATDINFRMRRILRVRFYMAIHRRSKTGSAVKDLGCSIEEFRTHIESKFKNGMSWSNYGKWHIDHIIPLSSFNLTERSELLKACHYTNLQPLWAEDNLRKGHKH